MRHSEGTTRPLTLREHDLARQQAWADHHAEFECGHAHAEMRKRKTLAGGWQLVNQCMGCGQRLGNALPQAGVVMADVAGFDEQRLATWLERRKEHARETAHAFSREAWLASYGPYLASAAWRSKRAKVMERARGACEGCAEGPPTQVHHLSYAHVGNEFLFELAALCDACHGRIHAEVKA